MRISKNEKPHIVVSGLFTRVSTNLWSEDELPPFSVTVWLSFWVFVGWKSSAIKREAATQRNIKLLYFKNFWSCIKLSLMRSSVTPHLKKKEIKNILSKILIAVKNLELWCIKLKHPFSSYLQQLFSLCLSHLFRAKCCFSPSLKKSSKNMWSIEWLELYKTRLKMVLIPQRCP